MERGCQSVTAYVILICVTNVDKWYYVTVTDGTIAPLLASTSQVLSSVSAKTEESFNQ